MKRIYSVSLLIFASMFSAQIGMPGNRKMGMNSDEGRDNYKLLLNSMHWLDGILEH
ncbi:MAG: hypothetical protein ABJH04_10005 [Cyclobacteriaceae bacterium]